jgi:alpha-tubulin suppressor-like RCC1 family protein
MLINKTKFMKTLPITLICFLFCLSLSAQCWENINSGREHTFAQKTDGSSWVWGNNYYGAYGNGSTNYVDFPTEMQQSTQWSTLVAGAQNSFGIKADGSLWAWGKNSYGILCDGTTMDRLSPIQIGTDTKWQKIEAQSQVIALKTDGTLWSWGFGIFGQLGIGSDPLSQGTPIQIGADSDWIEISAGSRHSMAIKANGTLWAWGNNDSGQFGVGNNMGTNAPIQVGTGTDWKQINAGNDYSIAMKTDGTLWACGWGQYGQLGTGTTDNSSTFQQIGTDNDWKIIKVGVLFNLAIKNDGSLWGWGLNNLYQLGINSTTTQFTAPKQVGTDLDWATIEAGDEYGIGVKTNGSLWAWGYNLNGQLGDGTTDTRLTPTQIGACISDTHEQSIADNTYTIAPNPTTDFFTITSTKQASFDLKLTSAEGKTLLSGRFNQDKVFDLSAYAAGVYFLNINDGREFFSVKVVKE